MQFKKKPSRGVHAMDQAENPKLAKLAELSVQLQRLAAEHHKHKKVAKPVDPDAAEEASEVPNAEEPEAEEMEAEEPDADHPLADLMHKPAHGKTMHMDITRLKQKQKK